MLPKLGSKSAKPSGVVPTLLLMNVAPFPCRRTSTPDAFTPLNTLSSILAFKPLTVNCVFQQEFIYNPLVENPFPSTVKPTATVPCPLIAISPIVQPGCVFTFKATLSSVILGRAEAKLITKGGVPLILNSMISSKGSAFTQLIASRKEPSPLSLVFVTVTVVPVGQAAIVRQSANSEVLLFVSVVVAVISSPLLTET